VRFTAHHPLLFSVLLPTLLLTRGSASEPAAVSFVYPTSSQLPANHLKFFVCFSRPVDEEVLPRFSLWNLTRDLAVEEPFRETALWNDERTRLTL
jgi:hypothetical protein